MFVNWTDFSLTLRIQQITGAWEDCGKLKKLDFIFRSIGIRENVGKLSGETEKLYEIMIVWSMKITLEK